MWLSDTSIKRPVLASVVSMLIVLAGITAYLKMPVREYPDVENPIVSITTAYTGASPETVETTITQPIEEDLNGLTDVRTITSKSAYGQSSINVEFKSSRDIDDAATEVNNAVQRSLRKIPEEAERPIITKSTANSNAIIWISLQGEKYTAEELTDIADRIIKPQLQILPGVSSVKIGGERKYAMRVWIDPIKLASRNLDINDVEKALEDNNIQLPAGRIKSHTRQFNILADGQIEDPKIYESIVIKTVSGTPVYLRDIGYVELGSENYDSLARYEGSQIIGLGIVKQSKANELKVASEVKKALPKIKESLPADIVFKVVVDKSLYILAALKEVFNSFFIAILLVVLVTLLFLRRVTATTIISLSIPISIVGAFAIMYLLGYSINVLTMLALILAIGIVVDDAIVVLENIYRRQEEGEDKKTAAFKGAREVGFPVIATTLCLVAVFIPLSLLSGSTGKLFKEFSLSVAFAVCISSFIALTLIPSLCARFLSIGEKKEAEEGENKAIQLYEKSLQLLIRYKLATIIFIIANLIGGVYLFTIIPKTFTPTEDRGYFITIVKAPEGSTISYTSEVQQKVEDKVKEVPEVTRYFSGIGLGIGGPPNPSEGIVFASLKAWKKRNIKQQAIVGMLFPEFMKIPNALIFPINPASLGQSSLKKDIEYIVQGPGNLSRLLEIKEAFLEKARALKGIYNLDSDLKVNSPQVDIIFKRDRIADANLSIQEVAKTLKLLFSESKVNEFILNNKQYDVITSLVPKYRISPNNIKEIYIHNKSGIMYPLDSLIEIKQTTSPTEINHYNLQRSITVSASLTEGTPLASKLSAFNKIAKEVIPKGYATDLGGLSREYRESSSSLNFTFIIALIFIYLMLAATFESFIHPLIIIFSVPLALIGAFITLLVTSQHLSLYSQIGIILLVGLVTKNSILIVDYANERVRATGKVIESVIDACKVRFRPIIMTAITMVFGTLPLLFSLGAGAESRFALGSIIVGGLIFSTVFTLFVIPVIYTIFIRKKTKAP